MVTGVTECRYPNQCSASMPPAVRIKTPLPISRLSLLFVVIIPLEGLVQDNEKIHQRVKHYISKEPFVLLVHAVSQQIPGENHK